MQSTGKINNTINKYETLYFGNPMFDFIKSFSNKIFKSVKRRIIVWQQSCQFLEWQNLFGFWFGWTCHVFIRSAKVVLRLERDHPHSLTGWHRWTGSQPHTFKHEKPLMLKHELHFTLKNKKRINLQLIKLWNKSL